MIFLHPKFSGLLVLLACLIVLPAKAQEPVDVAARIAIIQDVLESDSIDNEFANIILDKINRTKGKQVDEQPDPSGLSDYLKSRSGKDRRSDTLLTKSEVEYLKKQAASLKELNWKNEHPPAWIVKPYDNSRDALFSQADRKKFTIEDAWRSFQISYGPAYLDFSMPLICSDGVHAFLGITYRCGPLCDQKGLLFLHLEDGHWKIVDCLTFLVGSAY